MDQEAIILELARATERFAELAEEFAANYGVWANRDRSRCRTSYSFNGNVDTKTGTFYLEEWCCGETDTVEVPLSYLWTTEWIPLEEARLAAEKEKAARALEARRAAESQQARDTERAQYERLKSRYEGH